MKKWQKLRFVLIFKDSSAQLFRLRTESRQLKVKP